MRQNLSNIWWSNDFPGGSELTWASEEPQNGGKMIRTDKLEFRDINEPSLMPKYSTTG